MVCASWKFSQFIFFYKGRVNFLPSFIIREPSSAYYYYIFENYDFEVILH